MNQLSANFSNQVTLYGAKYFDSSYSWYPSDAPYSAQNTSLIGGRVIKLNDDYIDIMPKSPLEVVGEKVLRPLLDTSLSRVSWMWNILVEGLYQVDQIFARTVTLPVAAALKAPNKLESLRDLIGGLNDVVLTEDMIQKIYEDKTGVDFEPRVVKKVKEIIEILGSISDPSEFYGILQNGLEDLAKNKLIALAKQKRKADQDYEWHLAQQALRDQRIQLDNKNTKHEQRIKSLEDEAGNKLDTMKGIQEEIDQNRDEYLIISQKREDLAKSYNIKLKKYKKADKRMKEDIEWFNKNIDQMDREAIQRQQKNVETWQEMIRVFSEYDKNTRDEIKNMDQEKEELANSVKNNLQPYLDRTRNEMQAKLNERDRLRTEL